ncbi:MAG: hypothetical protein AB8B88_13100 [Devosiaceae bacterium]
MLSVIIRTRNGEAVLLDVLRPLVAAAAEGIVRDVVFLDLASTDGTAQIADASGATYLAATGNADAHTQQALTAAHRAPWVMLLDQATVLSSGWQDEAVSFVERQERVKTSRGQLSAVFRPEHEPESGNADVRRRLAILAANRLFGTARLSQGILVRRSVLQGEQGRAIKWSAADPAVRLPNILRLRSRTHLAQPIGPLDQLGQAQLADGSLSRAAL